MTRQPSVLQRVFVEGGKLRPGWRAGLYLLAYVATTLTVQMGIAIVPVGKSNFTPC